MIYDNGQAIYLAHLVYSFKLEKGNTRDNLAFKFRSIIKLNFLMVLIDTTGTFLLVYDLYMTPPASVYMISACLVSLHCSMLTIIYTHLRDMALVGVKKEKQVQQVQQLETKPIDTNDPLANIATIKV
ncbi:hypothetical protein HDV04_002548 [Boothiomyces sp. JEL0838]|nr:hypothetical protein HDV04_002548 [Boothiomyces sp. JEL0838]